MKIFTFVSACIFVLGYFLYCKLENENHDLIMLLQICRDYRTQPFQLKYEQVLYKTRSEIGEYTPREFYSPRPSPYPQQGLFLAKGGGSVKNMAAAGAESLTTATPKSFPAASSTKNQGRVCHFDGHGKKILVEKPMFRDEDQQKRKVKG